ncbi:nicotinate-nucleotide pyrophosphorylase (carboxylating) [Methanolinea mesophila]|uniref:carboxylating nicotinate-nucleotide diphosphorylase n=1 Tax=Methanolinea mesophila TaxID=547055 RepID=UPI001AE12FC0|nr:carboxylating nicotinate-nucleotide diphosphorylase [Methanolinea mesophila]MBP1928564.1 nicotinate-nucleotide pyrophosphorylase (carboxylating) [Methanolinea mesophila]
MVDREQLLGFLSEDAPYGDLTSELLIDPSLTCHGVIQLKETGIIAGLEEAAEIFSILGVAVNSRARDGELVVRGGILLELEGPARGVLLGERTALNIIGRMSGIATKTREIADKVREKNSSCTIACTRKTAPGLRVLDKKAVALGGGVRHRFGLSDAVLIKDNHLLLLPLEEAISRAKMGSVYHRVEVEVRDADQARRAALAGADIIMLDNMTPEAVAGAVRAIRGVPGGDSRIIEVSGGICEENAILYALPGVDVISMGCLTHSVVNLDVSLDFLPDL